MNLKDIAKNKLLKKYPEWEKGEIKPTLNQLKKFAKFTHVGVGKLLLSEPPKEECPIKDFRTLKNDGVARPSPNLLDTIYLCQQRQAWYRDYVVTEGSSPLEYVGSSSLTSNPKHVARKIRTKLNFGEKKRLGLGNWENAQRQMSDAIENIGVLVMNSGIVGNNTKRKLETKEFRGFSLVDDYAPLVFINGSDAKKAQMFTLVHELAHIWLGTTGISNFVLDRTYKDKTEIWCNSVAAEVLVPTESLLNETRKINFGDDKQFKEEIEHLAKVYKVSNLVMLCRLFDTKIITHEPFIKYYYEEMDNYKKSEGGDFYRTTPIRTSKKFSRALINSTLEGGTLYRDAMKLLCLSKASTFDTYAEKIASL